MRNKQLDNSSSQNSSSESQVSSSSIYSYRKKKSISLKRKEKISQEHKIKNNRNNHCIHVDCLTVNVNDSHLKEIFSIYGKINKIIKNKTPKNQKTQISSVIQYDRKESAENAEKCMNGGQIDGVEIKVKFFNFTDQEIESFKADKKIDFILKERDNLRLKENQVRKNISTYKKRRLYSPNKKTNNYSNRYKSRSRSRSKRNYSRKRSRSQSSSSNSSSSYSSSSSSNNSSSSYSSSSSKSNKK